MRRFLLIFLCLLPLLAAQANVGSTESLQGPLYIVDGEVGVSQKDIPPADEIASVTILQNEEAVELYGERAAYGVVVVRTKQYEQENIKKDYGKSLNNGNKKRLGKLVRFVQKITGGNRMLYYIVTSVIIILLFVLPMLIPGFITKYKKRHKKYRGRNSTYYPGTFDASGEVFRVTDNPWYFISLLLPLAGAVGLCIVLYRMATSPKVTFSVLTVLVFILFIALLVFLCCLAYGYYEERKCHLIIDKEGIRGTYAKPQRFPFKQKFRNVTIRWDELEDVEMICENENFLAFYHKKEAIIPYKSINLEFLPTKKIINCINFFYAHKMKEDKQSPRVKPVPFENSTAFILILFILMALLLWYLGV